MEMLNELERILKEDSRFVSEDGTILKTKVYDSAMAVDKSLLELLMKNSLMKNHFFTEIDEIVIFDKIKFSWVVESKEFLPDSYTKYKNKIGLVDDRNKLFSKSSDVSLIWPYKDCVLEGGQTKEEKRNEIFYNQTLAPDEVNHLLYPKIFTNVKRYSEKGAEDTTEFNDDDNLIVKGNNLLALSSLLKRYEGQIKCIYIDPPYFFHASKSEDTFTYNSNFKLSTWLTFMKNRLELAKKLLTDDGAIFVQISDDGVAELHILLKEIFGYENFINKITLKTKSPSGFASVNAGVFETAEYILSFAKNKNKWKYNPQHVKSEYDSNYKWVVLNKDKPSEEWEIENIRKVVSTENGYDSDSQAKEQLGEEAFNALIAEYALNKRDKVFRPTAIGNKAGQKVVEARDLSKENRDEIIEVHREGQYTVYVYNGQEMAFYSKKVREIDGELTPSMQLSNIWTDTPYEGIASEGGVKLKGGKKPEKLIKRILELSTNPGDLVMDFFLGSGTTAAVAHKIGRKYIGCEQLDTHMEMILDRMKEVIDGDQTGISKLSNWQGGGSFVYCELKELNESYISKIQRTNDQNELLQIKTEICNTGFVSHKIDLKDFLSNNTAFMSHSLDAQKKLLLDLLDKNKLYVNYCDIEDEEMGINEIDTTFTNNFYKRRVE